jgi:hypothetical protein
LTDSTTPRTSVGRLRRLAPAALVLASLLLLGPAAADAGVSYKKGNYSGATKQTTVNSPFNQIKFTVKKGKIILTTEPTVAKGLCLSAPVFTLDGPATTKIKRGSFEFVQTYMGNKFDKISGEFTSSNKIEGTAIYHFPSQDLCSEGKVKVAFSAKRGK